MQKNWIASSQAPRNDEVNSGLPEERVPCGTKQSRLIGEKLLDCRASLAKGGNPDGVNSNNFGILFRQFVNITLLFTQTNVKM